MLNLGTVGGGQGVESWSELKVRRNPIGVAVVVSSSDFYQKYSRFEGQWIKGWWLVSALLYSIFLETLLHILSSLRY